MSDESTPMTESEQTERLDLEGFLTELKGESQPLLYRLFSPARLKTVPSPWKIRRGGLLLASRRARLTDGADSEGVLNAFRTDVEKSGIPLAG